MTQTAEQYKLEIQRKSREEYKAREKEIINLYYNRYSSAEIGQKYGITRQRVHNIIKNAQKRGIKRAFRPPLH